jgi:hypothetical protein
VRPWSASRRSSGSSSTQTASNARNDTRALSTVRAAAGQLEKTQAADNFRNLFEVPVLFYLLCVAIVLTGGSTPGLVTAAWSYVALRALHSVIHVTYNRVVHRFLVYVTSTLLLFGMWIAFAAGFLR